MAFKFSYFGAALLLGILLCACDIKCDKTEGDHSVADENEVRTPEAIRTKLLDGYHVQVPPPKIDGLATRVTISMDVHHIELDEVEQTFAVNCWLNMQWNDTRLSWNNTGLDRKDLRFGDTEIWKPDVTLWNNAYPTDTDHYGSTYMVVKSEGSVIWVVPARLTSHCTLNLIRWPYDTHTCTFKMGSWTHSGDEIDLELVSNELNPTEDDTTSVNSNALYFTEFMANTEWTVIASESTKNVQYYSCCPEPYQDIVFSITVQRNSPSYVCCVILPICIVAIVNIMVFLLPPTSGEKITLSAINCFIICMFLIYFEAKLPSLGDHLPLLVILYACNLVLVGISIVISVVVLNLSRTRRPSSPPQCLRLFCNVNFAQLLGLGHLAPFVSHTHSRLEEGVEMRVPRGSTQNHVDNNPEKEDQHTRLIDYDTPYMSNAEWILLASMIDRLSFIVYAVVTGIILGLCLA